MQQWSDSDLHKKARSFADPLDVIVRAPFLSTAILDTMPRTLTCLFICLAVTALPEFWHATATEVTGMRGGWPPLSLEQANFRLENSDIY